MTHSMNRHRMCVACGDIDGCHVPAAIERGDASTMLHFWHAQAEWSRKTFGADDVRGPAGPLKHLAKEVSEALADPTDLMEFVDMQFLVFDAARRAGFTLEQLVRGCFEKLEVNKARKWQTPTTDEAVEHVR